MMITAIVVIFELNNIMTVMMNLVAEHHPSRKEIPPENKQQATGKLPVFTSVMMENGVHNTDTSGCKAR